MKKPESLSEFSIISRFFSDGMLADKQKSSNILLGVGDDCALLQMNNNQAMALSMDTMVAGRHFPEQAPPEDIAYRAVAVAVSDLAAMGADPLAFTLGLTLPDSNENWLERFSRGLRSAANNFNISLIGGDTTKGSLAITVQVHGLLPENKKILRSGAAPGDTVFVSGYLGDAATALAVLNDDASVDDETRRYLCNRFYRPQPRIALGQALLPIASAAIDISDGLLADLGHIAEASGLGATIYADRLPISTTVAKLVDDKKAINHALIGGDDYELCFTASSSSRETLQQISSRLGITITEIGEMNLSDNVRCIDQSGVEIQTDITGYQHF